MTADTTPVPRPSTIREHLARALIEVTNANVELERGSGEVRRIDSANGFAIGDRIMRDLPASPAVGVIEHICVQRDSWGCEEAFAWVRWPKQTQGRDVHQHYPLAMLRHYSPERLRMARESLAAKLRLQRARYDIEDVVYV